LLFQLLQDYRKWGCARFAYQQMHMFGHDDISSDDEAVAMPHLFQFLLEYAVAGSRFEQRLSAITTEGDEVEVAGVVIAD